ncbi:MAG: MBL fold metallo-hydrolase [Deltaproteobacteria bacterium]|nr:MBL fold metallo-hydrolase [Deltaproteobacteria bacterium]
MILKSLPTGQLMVNSYILADEQVKEAAVFDPGGHVEKIMKVIREDDLRVKYIINTHTHFDHVGGNKGLQDATGAPILTHRDEAAALQGSSEEASMLGFTAADSEATHFIREGDILWVGSIKIDVIDLRGHSSAGLGFVFEGEIENRGKKEVVKAVICGDALFAGSIGRTDMPGGDQEILLDNIRRKIFTLPDDTLVLPGHGPYSSVGKEKRYNPFF